jgi:ABC-2 type transport system permease protein
MLRNIVLKTLRDRRRSLLWWSVGIFLYAVVVGVFWPVLEDQQEELMRFLEAYPAEMFAFFGIETAEEMFTPAGYLNSQAFGWLVPVAFAIYAAAMGAQLIAGEEEANTMDLLMSNPISRTRVAIEKWIGMAIVMTILGAALLFSVVINDLLFGLGIAFDRYFAVCIQATLVGFLFGSVAFAVGALGGRRGLILGVVSGIAVATFLVNSLRSLADWLDAVAYASPFYYYDSNRPLFDGFDWVNVVVLLAISVIGLAVALGAFPRRDIGT